MNNNLSEIVVMNNITKYYSEQECALSNINISIKKGEMIAIIGESGSGKSTLLNIIGGNIKKNSGSYMFQGKEFETLTKKERAEIKNKGIGYITQNFNLIEDISIYNNVKLPLLFNTNIKLDQIRSLVAEVVNQVGLLEYIDKKINRISGGQKQRVAIARAIVNQPKLIIADEPTGALDSKTTVKIMELLRRINEKEGITLLIATHNNYVAEMCSRVITLQDGRIIS